MTATLPCQAIHICDLRCFQRLHSSRDGCFFCVLYSLYLFLYSCESFGMFVMATRWSDRLLVHSADVSKVMRVITRGHHAMSSHLPRHGVGIQYETIYICVSLVTDIHHSHFVFKVSTVSCCTLPRVFSTITQLILHVPLVKNGTFMAYSYPSGRAVSRYSSSLSISTWQVHADSWIHGRWWLVPSEGLCAWRRHKIGGIIEKFSIWNHCDGRCLRDQSRAPWCGQGWHHGEFSSCCLHVSQPEYWLHKV